MLWLPLHPKYQAYCNKEMKTNDRTVQARMENAARLENCPLIDVHDYGVDEDFTDSFHITAGGAVEVSKKDCRQAACTKGNFPETPYG